MIKENVQEQTMSDFFAEDESNTITANRAFEFLY